MARRVRKEGRAIGPDSPPEEMHELRKSCKKLRYLMEFFQSLYPAVEVRGCQALKTILDNLGGFQDLAVQAAHLREMAARMRAEGLAEPGTLLAMGTLIGDLLRAGSGLGRASRRLRGLRSGTGSAATRGALRFARPGPRDRPEASRPGSTEPPAGAGPSD